MVALPPPAASVSTTPSAAGASAYVRPLPTSARVIQRITKLTGVHPHLARSTATLNAVAPDEATTSLGAKRMLEGVLAMPPVKKQKLIQQPKEKHVEKAALSTAIVAQREAELVRFLQQRAARSAMEDTQRHAHQVTMAYLKNEIAVMDATHADELAHLGVMAAKAKQRLEQCLLNGTMTETVRARNAEETKPTTMSVPDVGAAGASQLLCLATLEKIGQAGSATDDSQAPLLDIIAHGSSVHHMVGPAMICADGDADVLATIDAFLADVDDAFLADIDAFLADVDEFLAGASVTYSPDVDFLADLDEFMAIGDAIFLADANACFADTGL